jgi:DNA-binding NarL/FixJ family response regulator
MKVLLDEYEDIQVVGEASNGLKAIELVDQVKPDVVLIDLAMPVMDGIEAIKRIIANHPEERIIVLTSFAGDDKLFEAIRAWSRMPSRRSWSSRSVTSALVSHPLTQRSPGDCCAA